MRFIELAFLAVALSMDAFAAAVCAGLNMRGLNFKKAFTVGLYFGVFQAAMPLIGYLAASLFADVIIDYDHWIAFGLLSFLGGRMIWSGLKKETEEDAKETSLSPARMLPLALATSVDALAVGVSFAFLKVAVVPAVSFIGVTTLLLSMAGVSIGHIFGARYKSLAETAGGVILVLIGLKILLEHLQIISF